MNKMNSMVKIGALVMAFGLMGTTAQASTDNYGSAGVEDGATYTLEEMLEYAIEDEYLARAEYEAIIDRFEVDRPFSNILKAEETHIEELTVLYDAYGITLPEVDPSTQVVLPETLEEIYAIGVTAEINNIAMYEQFLSIDLPDDVEAVFEALQSASESHLQAFERGVTTSTSTDGFGNENNGQSQAKDNDLRSGVKQGSNIFGQVSDFVKGLFNGFGR